MVFIQCTFVYRTFGTELCVNLVTYSYRRSILKSTYWHSSLYIRTVGNWK